MVSGHYGITPSSPDENRVAVFGRVKRSVISDHSSVYKAIGSTIISLPSRPVNVDSKFVK